LYLAELKWEYYEEDEDSDRYASEKETLQEFNKSSNYVLGSRKFEDTKSLLKITIPAFKEARINKIVGQAKSWVSFNFSNVENSF
jgi:hypothetical protein